MDTFFSQSLISLISEVSPSTVSKYFSQKNIPFIDKNDNSRKKYSYDIARRAIKHLAFSDLIPQKQTHVFFNFKGGTGKTSLCYQLSSFFSLCGFNVLAIDCDPQANLSHAFGFDIYENYETLYDMIVNDVKFEDIVQNVYTGLDCLPSNLSLTRIELPLNQKNNRERVFLKLINPIKQKYDFIFVDTNPTISTLNRNITLAADELNIVCETQPFSLKSLEILMSEIKNFSDDMELNISLKIIPNKYDTKASTSHIALGNLRSEYENYITESLVRRCEDINISTKCRKPVIFWASKRSTAVQDICDLGREMIKNSTTKKV